MLSFKHFINTKYVSKLSKNYLYLNEYYHIKNYQKNINNNYILKSYNKYTMLFYNDFNDKELKIDFLNLEHYKIYFNDKNITNNLKHYYFNMLILDTVDIIYENHLKNQCKVNLNYIFDKFISRYKEIYNILQNIYYKADLNLEFTKNKEYIIHWNKLI